MDIHRDAGELMKRFVRESALTLGAVAGITCMTLAAAAAFFGIIPMIVRSGSMGSAMPVGSLVLAHQVPGTSVHPGDIISVKTTDGTRVTHRVVRVAAPSQVAVSVYLKGDANTAADPAPYVVGTADRVTVTVPYAGYLASWFQTTAGRVLGLLGAIALLYIAFRQSGPGSTPSWRQRLTRLRRTFSASQRGSAPHGTRPRPRHAASVATLGVAVALCSQQVGIAHAATLTDSATMTSSLAMANFTNSVPGANGAYLSAVGNGAVGCTVSWTAPSTGYGVQLAFLPSGVAVPTDMAATPTTNQSVHTFSSSTLTYSATATTDIVGTPTSLQYFTLRTVRTSDGFVSANFGYGYAYRTTTGTYICALLSADGRVNYTWPSITATSTTTLAASLKSLKVTSSTTTTTSSSTASSTSTETSSTSSSTTTSSTTASESSTATSENTSTVTATVPAGATSAPSGDVYATLTGTTLTLTDATTSAAVYTTTVQANSTLTWDTTSDILTVHQPDGSTVIVKKVNDTWTAFDATSATTTTSSSTAAERTTESADAAQSSTATTQATTTTTEVPAVTAAQ